MRTEHFDVGDGGEMDGEDERSVVHAFHWWAIPEIVASDETFAPLDLGKLLSSLIGDGPPDDRIDTGM